MAQKCSPSELVHSQWDEDLSPGARQSSSSHPRSQVERDEAAIIVWVLLLIRPIPLLFVCMLLQNDSNFMTATSARMNPHITQKTLLTLTNSILSQQNHSIIKTIHLPSSWRAFPMSRACTSQHPEPSNVAYLSSMNLQWLIELMLR